MDVVGRLNGHFVIHQPVAIVNIQVRIVRSRADAAVHELPVFANPSLHRPSAHTPFDRIDLLESPLIVLAAEGLLPLVMAKMKTLAELVLDDVCVESGEYADNGDRCADQQCGGGGRHPKARFRLGLAALVRRR